MGYLICFLCVFGKILLFSDALFEDQTGKYDWRVERVGGVSKAVFDPVSVKSSVPSKTVFVASSQENVLAALSLKTGNIVWRQVLEQETEGRNSLNNIDSLVLRDRSVLSLSSGGQFLRSWGRVKGFLQWESPVSETFCPNAEIVPSLSGADSSSGVITILACDLVASFGAKNGHKLWDLNLDQNEKNVEWLGAVSTEDGDLYVVGGSEVTQKVFVRTLNTWNGASRHDKLSIDAPWFNKKKCGLVHDSLICLDSTGLNLFVLDLRAPQAAKSRQLAHAGAELVIVNGALGVFATRSADGYTIFKLNRRTGLQEITHLDRVWCVSAVQEDGDVPESLYLVVGRASRDGSTQDFSWIRVTDGKEVAEWASTIPLARDRVHFFQVFPLIVKKADGTSHPRFLGISADGDLSFVEKGSILSVEIVDLPLSEAQANIEKEFSAEADNVLNMLVRRLRTQALQIQRALIKAADEVLGITGFIGKEWVKGEGSFLQKAGLLVEKAGHSSDSSIFERDYFDLHKMIVAVTQTGKLFGLDNRNGQIIWEFWVDGLEGMGVEGAGEESLPLFVQRTTAHYPHPAQCAVVGKHKNSGNGYTVVFNPMTGEVIDKRVWDFPVGQAILLPFTNEEEIHGILLTDRDKHEATLIPRNLAIPNSAPIFVMKMDGGKSTGVHGYHFVLDAKEQTLGAPGSRGKLVRVWRTALSLSPGQEIVHVAGKKFTEKVHSQGRVLGDRSVLYKYANPNLVSVIGLGTAGGAGDSDGLRKGANSQMTIFMLDAVNGQVVFSAQHPRAAGPVHVVHCENWVVYSYWNEKGRRTEMSVLEMYEGKSQTDGGAFSSHTPLPSPPLVMRQSYVFPQGISALSVTDTEKGLTNRQLLLAMPFGGILELPKNFLDPRRALIPTRETAEEGMIPYVPDLPVATEHIVNYNQSVIRIKRIHAAPSGLESTSLVLAYGLDMYFTRITPSGTFDILKDDFDHWFISAVLTALVLASVVSKKLAKRRDLKQAWK